MMSRGMKVFSQKLIEWMRRSTGESIYFYWYKTAALVAAELSSNHGETALHPHAILQPLASTTVRQGCYAPELDNQVPAILGLQIKVTGQDAELAFLFAVRKDCL